MCQALNYHVKIAAPRYNARSVSTKASIARGPGRPRKFGRASRAVTVTLPEDVLAQLASIDPDLGRAIVASVARVARPRARMARPAELATFGNHAVILVTPIKALKRIAGVELIPIGQNRALIALAGAHQIPRLELDIRDAIQQGESDPREQRALEALADILRDARLSRRLTVEERTIIVLESARRRRA
jgi:hypothetical protein